MSQSQRDIERKLEIYIGFPPPTCRALIELLDGKPIKHGGQRYALTNAQILDRDGSLTGFGKLVATLAKNIAQGASTLPSPGRLPQGHARGDFNLNVAKRVARKRFGVKLTSANVKLLLEIAQHPCCAYGYLLSLYGESDFAPLLAADFVDGEQKRCSSWDITDPGIEFLNAVIDEVSHATV